MEIHKCSILVPCPHFKLDQPCQFVGGNCYIQDHIIETADAIKRARNSPKAESAEKSDNTTNGEIAPCSNIECDKYDSYHSLSHCSSKWTTDIPNCRDYRA